MNPITKTNDQIQSEINQIDKLLQNKVRRMDPSNISALLHKRRHLSEQLETRALNGLSLKYINLKALLNQTLELPYGE